MEDMAKKLKKARLELNITQTEAAYQAEISQRYLAFLEKGDRTPSLFTLRKLATLYNKSLDFFCP